MYQAQGYILFPRLPNNSQLQGAGIRFLDIPMQAPNSKALNANVCIYSLITKSSSKFGTCLCPSIVFKQPPSDHSPSPSYRPAM